MSSFNRLDTIIHGRSATSDKNRNRTANRERTLPPKAFVQAKPLLGGLCSPVHALRSGDSGETDARACRLSLKGGLLSLKALSNVLKIRSGSESRTHHFGPLLLASDPRTNLGRQS